jgi:hypothetical protein
MGLLALYSCGSEQEQEAVSQHGEGNVVSIKCGLFFDSPKPKSFKH